MRTDGHSRRLARRTVAFVAVVASVGLVSPAARASVRYRDEMFRVAKTATDVVYGRAVNSRGRMETLKLDVYEPVSDVGRLRAAVVYVHGGYFTEGSKETETYVDAAIHFARAGYVTFSIDYRLRPELPRGAGAIVMSGRIQEAIDTMRDGQHDAQAAVRYVRRHAEKYRVDPERVAMAGKSAGAIITQLAVYNDHDPGTSGNAGFSSRVAAGVSLAGASVPILLTRVDPLEPPLLLVHGAADDIVPIAAAPSSCIAAILLANICEFVIDPDQDHTTFGYEFALEFLHRQLIQRPVLRPPTKVTATGFP